MGKNVPLKCEYVLQYTEKICNIWFFLIKIKEINHTLSNIAMNKCLQVILMLYMMSAKHVGIKIRVCDLKCVIGEEM